MKHVTTLLIWITAILWKKNKSEVNGQKQNWKMMKTKNKTSIIK